MIYEQQCEQYEHIPREIRLATLGNGTFTTNYQYIDLCYVCLDVPLLLCRSIKMVSVQFPISSAYRQRVTQCIINENTNVIMFSNRAILDQCTYTKCSKTIFSFFRYVQILIQLARYPWTLRPVLCKHHNFRATHK